MMRWPIRWAHAIGDTGNAQVAGQPPGAPRTDRTPAAGRDRPADGRWHQFHRAQRRPPRHRGRDIPGQLGASIERDDGPRQSVGGATRPCLVGPAIDAGALSLDAGRWLHGQDRIAGNGRQDGCKRGELDPPMPAHLSLGHQAHLPILSGIRHVGTSSSHSSPAAQVSLASGRQQAPSDPRAADHLRMGAEDDAAGQLLRIASDAAPWRRRARRHRSVRLGSMHDEVGLLARLDRADGLVEAQRPRAVERSQPQPVERAEDRPRVVGSGPAARSACRRRPASGRRSRGRARRRRRDPRPTMTPRSR